MPTLLPDDFFAFPLPSTEMDTGSIHTALEQVIREFAASGHQRNGLRLDTIWIIPIVEGIRLYDTLLAHLLSYYSF